MRKPKFLTQLYVETKGHLPTNYVRVAGNSDKFCLNVWLT